MFGAHFRKSQHSLRDYFLGGRRLPWWAIALSVVSAETSILTIISTPGIAYRSNMGFLQLVLGYLMARVVVSFVFIPRYFAGELFTAYQLIEQRFGQGLKIFTAALFLVTRALAEVVRVAHEAGNKFAVFDFHFNWRDPYLFWSGLVGGTFLTSASHGTDQLIVQRLLAARDKRQSQTALLSSGAVILFQFTLFLVVGVVLFAFYQRFPPSTPFARPDRVFPTFVVTQLPRGLAGLLIAAILAAAMSNLSAAFNSLASSSVMDFYKPFVRPGADEKHYLRVSRGLTLAWGVVVILIALLAQQLHQSVLELALTIASVPYGSMLGIFLLGVLTRRATGRGALIGAVLGLGALSLVMLANSAHLVSIAWTWYVAIGTSVTFVGGWLASVGLLTSA